MTRSSRAALLPVFGDPFCFAYWLNWFLWSSRLDVDKLYVIFSNADQERADVCRQLLEESGLAYDWYWQPEPMQHGDAIREMLEVCTEELVVLLEEDTVIFKEGALDEEFCRIERGECDAVASPRGSCSQWITDRATEKWAIPDRSYERDNNVNFWPCFYFGRKDDLLSTDRDFNARTWQPGELVEPLGEVAPETVVGDTFVSTSLQLRAMGLRFHLCRQDHGHPDDILDAEKRINIFDGNAKWVHHGSLSSWGMLFDPNHQPVPGLAFGEMARRCQWWRTFVDYFVGTRPGLLSELAQRYREGISNIMAIYSVPETEVFVRQRKYQKLFGYRI